MFAFKIRHFLNQKLDKSWSVYGGLWGVIIGVAAEFVGQVGVSWLWWLVLVIFTVIGLIFIKKSLARVLLAVVLGLIIGQMRAAAVFGEVANYQTKVGQVVEISGRLFDDATFSQSGALTLRLSSIRLDGKPMLGKILVTTRQKLAVMRGDEIVVVGKLKAGEFGYDALIDEIQSIEVLGLGDPMTKARDWLDGRLRAYLPSEQADLVSAILLGKRSTIEASANRQIRVVGLSHIVVASGMHLVIVVAVFRKIFAKISRRAELFGALFGALMFALMAGLTASMVRALMAMVLVMSAWYVGRKISAWRVLSVLIAVSLLLNPLHLNGDLSWWLSYGAFFAVMVAVPTAEAFFFGDQKLGKVKRLVLAVVIVQLVLMPILLASFGELSLISVLANLLVVPLILPLMWLASLVVVLADLAPLAWLMAYPLQLIMHYILGVIEFLAEVPLAMIKINASPVQVVIITSVLTLFIVMMSCRNHVYNKRQLGIRQKEFSDDLS